ncbi:MAG: (Fe-S)-binding protein [Methanobacteriota archaeon]|nr:MAG: (Fe-S)-binding protein [Euryarchaeota archaeon]
MDDLEVCMRCGFCRASCPVFDETLAESGTARGKIAIIHALLQGELEPTETVRQRIFECTLCGRCAQSCPAGVDTTEIFIRARQELLGKKVPLLKRAAFNVLERPKLLSLASSAASLIPERLLSVPEKSAGAQLQKIEDPEMRVLFFGGCLANHMLPGLKDASLEVLARNRVEVIAFAGKCCGAPLYFSGAPERAERLARTSLDLVAEVEPDAIITPCPTCRIMLRRYPLLLEGNYRKRAERAAERTYEICEFLATFGYEKDFQPSTGGERTVTLHESCHGAFIPGHGKTVRDIIRGLPEVALKEMDDPSACCGFGGLFLLDNPGLSKRINRKKLDDIKRTGAEEVVTPCPGCTVYLRETLKREGIDIKTRHPVELLRETYQRAGRTK